MAPRIAVPLPHSLDLEYSGRAIPQYEQAIILAGGEPVRVELQQSADEVRNLVQGCQGLLLPGSKADVDPVRFRVQRSLHTAQADHAREAVDDLLLEHAYRWKKPVLGICYGLQSLNVYRSGSLVQHIPDFLPAATRDRVNHEAGKEIPVAHTVEIERCSLLAEILDGIGHWNLPVNSSHHQSVDSIGIGLRVVAHCPDDGVIEALESTTRDHFVLAVQWHPERSVAQDESSSAIFRALIAAAGHGR